MTGPPPVLPPPPAVPPGQTYAPSAGRPTNGFAVVAIILAFMVPPAAVVFGHLALAQIRRSHGYEGGRGLALTGLTIGYASIVLMVVWTAAILTMGPD